MSETKEAYILRNKKSGQIVRIVDEVTAKRMVEKGRFEFAPDKVIKDGKERPIDWGKDAEKMRADFDKEIESLNKAHGDELKKKDEEIAKLKEQLKKNK